MAATVFRVAAGQTLSASSRGGRSVLRTPGDWDPAAEVLHASVDDHIVHVGAGQQLPVPEDMQHRVE